MMSRDPARSISARRHTIAHHGRHGEALEQEPFAAVAVSLKDHEVSIVAHLPAQRPVNQGYRPWRQWKSCDQRRANAPDLLCVKQPLTRPLELLPLGEPVFLQTQAGVNQPLAPPPA